MNDRLLKDYKKYIGYLSEVSYDKTNQCSLIEDKEKSHRVYNFDAISEKFYAMTRGEKSFSCDAYYEKSQDDVYLFEFKNQNEGNVDKVEIKNKIYDSVSLLVMNENLPRDVISSKVTAIIVYNNQKGLENSDNGYLPSGSFDRFAYKMAELSGKSGVDNYLKKFDLEKYKGVLFKEVYTVDKNVFEMDLMDHIFDDTGYSGFGGYADDTV